MMKNRIPVLLEEEQNQGLQVQVSATRQQMRQIVKQQDEDFRIALRKQSVGITDALSETLKSVVKNSCAHAVLDRSAKNFIKTADPTISRMEDMLAQMCHAAQILHHALEMSREGLAMGYGVSSERESQMIAQGIVVAKEGASPALQRDDVNKEEPQETEERTEEVVNDTTTVPTSEISEQQEQQPPEEPKKEEQQPSSESVPSNDAAAEEQKN